jgi:hypothetical protein
MKALSLTQPWATLVVAGEKEIETRSWRTNHHGMIAIHASKGFPGWARGESHYPPFREAIRRHGFDGATDLPLGAIVGVVTLMGCVTTESLRDRITDKEKLFGDYSDGRFGWYLDEPTMLTTPIPCRGALSLWEVPHGITARLLAALSLRDGQRTGAGRGNNSATTEGLFQHLP